jgi:hypothetical protein
MDRDHEEPDVTRHLDADRHSEEANLRASNEPMLQVVQDVGLYYRGYFDAMKSIMTLVTVLVSLAIIFLLVKREPV